MFMQFTGAHHRVLRFYLGEKAIDWLRVLITCVMRHAQTHKFLRSGPTVHFYTVFMTLMQRFDPVAYEVPELCASSDFIWTR